MKWTPIVAIIAIAFLESLALYKGINGVMLSLSVGSITGLGGYGIKVLKDRIKGGKLWLTNTRY